MAKILPLDTSCQAVYADGYIHDETTLEDVSPFQENKNVFYDILEKRPEAEHGAMVEFSVFYNNQKHTVDWTQLPDNARPIRFRDGASTLDSAGNVGFMWTGCRMGFQFNDESGKNIQDVREL